MRSAYSLRVSLGRHARNQPLFVRPEPAFALPRRHRAAQLIGLARRVIGGDDRELHHLLLKDRNAERSLEH